MTFWQGITRPRRKITRKYLPLEKQKMSAFFLIYNDEHQYALKSLIEEFSSKLKNYG
jgi:hypothetical protein